jgi:hypothetical protein
MAQLSFDATQVQPNTSFEPLPAGEYPVIIKDSEMRFTKDGSGSYLQLTLEVIDGNFKGRLVWDRLNLQNQNPVAQEIAQKQLSAICHAVNVLKPTDSAELHNIPLLAKVSFRPAKGEYDASNDVKAYKAFGGVNTAPETQSPAQQAEQPTQAAQKKPAWN